MSTLPSIEEVASKFAAPAEPASAAAQTVDPSEGKGGTTTDPSLSTEAPAEQTTTPEATATEAEPVVEAKPQEPDPIATKFAALARREREMRAKEAEFTRKMQEFEARMSQPAPKPAVQDDEPKTPLDVLKKYGFSYDLATQQMLGGWKPKEPDPIEERLKPVSEKLSVVDQLKTQLEELKNQLAAEKQQAAYNQAMDSIQNTIETGDYPLIKALGPQARDLVRDTMVEYWNANQKMLDFSEACDIVEAWYDENVVAPLSAVEKVKSRFSPPAAKPTPQATAPAKEAPKSPKQTLTNALNQGSQATVDIDKLSKDDAIAYLAKKIKVIDD